MPIISRCTCLWIQHHLAFLRGHVARANPIWQDFAEDVGVLVIFSGPNAYISPSWYATKTETGKVVPTWNYKVVHAYGSLKVIDDAAWLRSNLEALTSQSEASFTEQWQVSDAPHAFTEKLIESIVGIEIVITKLVGKAKVSQNQSPKNRASVIQGLTDTGHSDGLLIAAAVESYGKPS
ncbi:FMN-binding negative transcriptional regulator [Methylocucumis oryzae]|uniref:FMN-binding negative transcriptional regulator n=1 Tax=Methylocucumis oryzae TaxID=1632867 RepID=UPI001EF9CCDF|nr:FMN-binding negative transcriptional regulator [Methylocucumis oryzae]